MKTTWAVLVLGLICAVAACSLSNSGDDDDDDSDDDASDDDTDSDDDDVPGGGVDLSGDWDCYYTDVTSGTWERYENPINYDGCQFYGCGIVCKDNDGGMDVNIASLEDDTLTIISISNDTSMRRCTRLK